MVGQIFWILLNGLCAFGVHFQQIQQIDAQNKSYTLRWTWNMKFLRDKKNNLFPQHHGDLFEAMMMFETCVCLKLTCTIFLNWFSSNLEILKKLKQQVPQPFNHGWSTYHPLTYPPQK